MREMQTQLAESKHILRARLDTANFAESRKLKTVNNFKCQLIIVGAEFCSSAKSI